MSGENKSGSSMNSAYLDAFRKRKNELLASEIDFSQGEEKTSGNTSGKSAFLEAFRNRKNKQLAAELNIVETLPEASKETTDVSSQAVPQNRESFIPAVRSDEKKTNHFKPSQRNRETSVPAFYEGDTFRKKESEILSDAVGSQRSISDNSGTSSKSRFKRFSEGTSNEDLYNFFDEPTTDSDSTLMTSDLDSHSVLSCSEMESDSFESFSDMKSDTFQSKPDSKSDSVRSSAGFDSKSANTNTQSNSGKGNRKKEPKKPSKGKAKVAVLLSFVVMIVCFFIVISKMRSDSLVSDEDNTSSYIQDDTESNVANTSEQTDDTTDTTGTMSNDSTTATTSESTTEPSEETTTTTAATKHYDPISPGQRSDDVMKMQKRLNKLGYINKESCTGYYGEYTEKIVKMFQQKAGLKQTGIADSETLARLYASDAPDCLH